jgi:hypothetical protein
MLFEVGDRVLALGFHDGEDMEGLTGTIRRINPDEEYSCYLVSFDNWTGGHDGQANMSSNDRSCWWMPAHKMKNLTDDDRTASNPYFKIERKIKQMRERREAMGYKF